MHLYIIVVIMYLIKCGKIRIRKKAMLEQKFLALEKMLESSTNRSFCDKVDSLIESLVRCGYSVINNGPNRIDLIKYVNDNETKKAISITESNLWRWGKENEMVAGKPANRGLVVGYSMVDPIVEFEYIPQFDGGCVLAASIFNSAYLT